MGKFIVIDQDNYEPDKGVELEKEDIVDRDGYRDVQMQVEEMIRAGERLEAYRKGQYDFEPGDKEAFSTEMQSFDREPGFDPADITRLVSLAKEEQAVFAEKIRKQAESVMEKKEIENAGAT